MSLFESYLAFFRYPNVKDSRLQIVLWYDWFALVGLLIASRGLPPLMYALKTVLMVSFLTMYIYILNDIMDAKMDVGNEAKSGRPIPSGLVSEKDAFILCLVNGIIGISIALTVKIQVAIVAAFYLFLGTLYSTPPIRLKTRFLMKETITIAGWFCLASLGSLATGTLPFSIVYFMSFFTVFIMTLWSTFYDALDEEEDKRVGCKTVATLLKQSQRLELSAIGLTAMMLVTPFTYSMFGFNMILPIVICVACILFLRFIFPLLLKPDTVDDDKIMRGSTVLRIFFLTMQIGFVLGSLNIL